MKSVLGLLLLVFLWPLSGFARSLSVALTQYDIESPIRYSSGLALSGELGNVGDLHIHAFLNTWRNREDSAQGSLFVSSVGFGLDARYRFQLEMAAPYFGVGFGLEEFEQSLGHHSFGETTSGLMLVFAGLQTVSWQPYSGFLEWGQTSVALYREVYLRAGVAYDL